MRDIKVLTAPINFDLASENVKKSMQTLFDVLATKSEPRHGGPMVNVFIHNNYGEMIMLPPNAENRAGLMSHVSAHKPMFDITLHCATTKDTGWTRIVYNYDVIKGLATQKKEEEEIEEGHEFSSFEDMATKIIESTCLMIFKKAEEEMCVFKKWQKILN